MLSPDKTQTIEVHWIQKTKLLTSSASALSRGPPIVQTMTSSQLLTRRKVNRQSPKWDFHLGVSRVKRHNKFSTPTTLRLNLEFAIQLFLNYDWISLCKTIQTISIKLFLQFLKPLHFKLKSTVQEKAILVLISSIQTMLSSILCQLNSCI